MHACYLTFPVTTAISECPTMVQTLTSLTQPFTNLNCFDEIVENGDCTH